MFRCTAMETEVAVQRSTLHCNASEGRSEGVSWPGECRARVVCPSGRVLRVLYRVYRQQIFQCINVQRCAFHGDAHHPIQKTKQQHSRADDTAQHGEHPEARTQKNGWYA